MLKGCHVKIDFILFGNIFTAVATVKKKSIVHIQLDSKDNTAHKLFMFILQGANYGKNLKSKGQVEFIFFKISKQRDSVCLCVCPGLNMTMIHLLVDSECVHGLPGSMCPLQDWMSCTC